MENLKISICIPAYEMHGRGAEFLRQLLSSIEKQSYKNFEVVVSDHSQNDLVKNECDAWQSKLSLVYLRCSEMRGNSSVNINNAIRSAKGDIIKPMHQDDFFFSPEALGKIAAAFSAHPESTWGASAFVHTNEKSSNFFRYQTPGYLPTTPVTKNTIGAPSVMFFRNHKNIYFDEKLIWMNDGEMAFRLNKNFGSPLIIKETLVVIRQWPQQVTHTLASMPLRVKEIRYSFKKHGNKFGFTKMMAGKVKGRLQYLTRKAYAGATAAVADLLPAAKKLDPLTKLSNRYRSDKGTKKLFAWGRRPAFLQPGLQCLLGKNSP